MSLTVSNFWIASGSIGCKGRFTGSLGICQSGFLLFSVAVDAFDAMPTETVAVTPKP